MYNITSQQIETFLTVAKYMNLSRAAEAMYISQPALSKTLQRFEERIGIRLFSRSNYGISLTPEGAYLFKVLEPLYAGLNEAIDEAHAIAQQSIRRLRFVFTSVYDVAEIFVEAKNYINRFALDHPDIEIVESLCEYKEVRRALEYGRDDLAIVYDFVLEGMKNISYKRITEFPLYLAMSAKHPLAQYAEMPPAELLESEVFYRVGYLDDEASLPIYEDECRQAGFAPKRFVFVSNMQTLFHAICEMRGMSLCTKFSSFGSGDEVKYYTIPPFREKKYTVAAWRSDMLGYEARLFINNIPGEEIRLS